MLRHISYGEGPYSLAILVPTKDFNEEQILQHYVEPLVAAGIDKKEIIAFNLAHNQKGKAPINDVVRPYLEILEPALRALDIKHVLIGEGNYFKTICKARKADPHYGYQMETIWPGISGYITLNYKALLYNPAMQQKIDFSVQAVTAALAGKDGLFAEKALKNGYYPEDPPQIAQLLESLHKRPAVTVDIEAYSLLVSKAQVATISFGLDMSSAVAFPVGQDQAVKELLRTFFETYQGGLIFHNATYDVKVIIWELFMKHPTDYKGMLHGLDVMFRRLHDTKIISYLALNSTAEVAYSLKDLAFAHTGNYAQDDIKDITKIPLPELLEYNATDAIATWYVYDKFRKVVKSEQESVYQEVFRPTLKTLTQMELCGTPINMGAVLNAEKKMDDIRRHHLNAILDDPIIQEFEWVLRDLEAHKANKKLKKLRKTREDFLDLRFNPNSDTQLAILLHTFWDLPVLEKTDGGNPSTKNEVLKSLIKHVEKSNKWSGEGIEDILEHIIELHDVAKILSTFIPAFKSNSIPKDGWHYLHGGFNLGGTRSGRLSSSEPNMQNIPSTGTQYAKLIKECFQPPPLPTIMVPGETEPGWIFVGADYASLEDRISALLTKDPNKLAVYVDGYDGHCLRAYYYFKDQMPDITAEIEAEPHRKVEIINSIEQRYPKIRQASKGPTFLLTYMGTWKGLQKTFGFSQEESQGIEANYHDMYAVADQWVEDRLEEAHHNGYVELAFGLRLRTPMLPRVVWGSASMPYAAISEKKTAGNALGQSYGLLNSHSANLFMRRVWDSEYRYKVFPCMQVHDSQYYMVENTLKTLKWVNDNLIACMEWNDLSPIQHDTVKLGATLELYHQSWAQKISLPNYVSEAKLREVVRQGIAKQKLC